MRTALWLVVAAHAASAGTATAWGKAAFVGVFAALLVWLLLLPARLIDQHERHCPWWRNVRFWAIVVTIVQIWVYAWWG